MNKTQYNPDDILVRLVAHAVDMDADELSIEYDNGYEEITAIKGDVGFGIANLESSGAEACALRKQLQSIGRKGKIISSGETHYYLKVTTYNSFGETAYKVQLRKGP